MRVILLGNVSTCVSSSSLIVRMSIDKVSHSEPGRSVKLTLMLGEVY